MSLRGPDGSGNSVHDVSVRAVREACARLREVRPALLRRSSEQLARVLGSVGARFLDSDDPLRREALERLPHEAGLSRPMAAEVLEGMALDWSADRLLQTLRAEFGDPGCLDAPTEVDGRRLMALGPALCVQIVSGSVPGVGVHALLRSLLVKAPTLIKPGRGDEALTELFARGLGEVDVGLSDALTVLRWPGGSEALEREAMAAADVAVVYGSDATVAALRAMAPATTRIVAYHHRTGVALVGRDSDPGRAAGDLARSVALFEQRGCVCPHHVWVEAGGPLDASDFASHVAGALADLESSLPSAPLSPHDASALQQFRGTSELRAGASGGRVWHGGPAASWTVVFEPNVAPGPSTFARGLRVHTLLDLEEAGDVLAPFRAHLQSVGYAGFSARTDRLMEIAGRSGASRVVPIRAMPFPPPWWLHDGRGPLRELVRWIEVEPER
jgi:hypothetical protein